MSLLVPHAPRPTAAAGAPELRVHVDLGSRPVRVVLAGELDIAGHEVVRSVLCSLLEDGRDRLAVDVSGLCFLDCSGAGALAAAERAADGVGCALELQGPCPPLARLLRACPDRWPASWSELS